MDSNSLLVHLNDKQREVVQTTEGPLLVLAGAGSGKTRSVIYRVAWLMQAKRVKPWNILVVTFTNKAAQELKERLEELYPGRASSVWIGTFHSICLRILRYEIIHLQGYNSDFSVFDRDDQLSVLKKVYIEQDIDKKIYPHQKILSVISKNKSNSIIPANFMDYNDDTAINRLFHRIYKAYDGYLLKNNAMDFDDLLIKTSQLLTNNDIVREKYSNQFQYIMIDEYQDTNEVQFNIIHTLAKKHKNLCVVGDDDQSIYGWRGANVKNILSFEKDYKNTHTIKLEQNYRSTTPILALANNLIMKNDNRHDKQLWTNIESNELPKLISHDNEYEEARYIAEEIASLTEKNKCLYQNNVVLYRTNAQSRVLEQAFTKNQIPYVVVGGINFYQRSEVKDMIAWLRILVNPMDNESLLRVINLPPRGLGKTSIGQLIDIAVTHNKSLFEIVTEEAYLSGVTKKVRQTLIDLSVKIKQWVGMSGKNSIVEIIKDIIQELDLEAYYRNADEAKEMTKLENIREFISASSEFTEKYYEEHQEYPSISQFLQNISLQTDLDSAEKRAERDAVRLMTMHNAKGLEFDYVFIAGMEQGLLPHTFSMGSKEELEEERRLLYVAITRAKKLLFMNYCHSRRMGDSHQYSYPSEFLKDMDTDLLDEIKASFWEKHAPKQQDYRPSYKSNIPVITENEKYFKIGQKIMHQSFGNGVILSIEGNGQDAKLTISFNSGLMKKIIGTWVEIINE